MTRHNSVSLRILNHIYNNEFDPMKEEHIKNVLESKNYTSKNPFYQERIKLNLDDSDTSFEESSEESFEVESDD